MPPMKSLAGRAPAGHLPGRGRSAAPPQAEGEHAGRAMGDRGREAGTEGSREGGSEWQLGEQSKARERTERQREEETVRGRMETGWRLPRLLRRGEHVSALRSVEIALTGAATLGSYQRSRSRVSARFEGVYRGS